MSKKLTPAMGDLLQAMKRGVRVHFMGGLYPYYFRSDTMKPCTKQVEALINRGLVERVETEKYRYEVRPTQTPEGER
jgi:hypothetical protein